jgi:hypothetical protein
MMITQIADPKHFHQRATDIRERVPAILSQWGLLAKFNRWRLTQDPDSGLVVLFAVLNTRYIAAHTTTPSSDYFQPRLLHDLANDLNMQVVSCDSDGLRYAFILDRGMIDILPKHIDIPFLDGDRLLVQVVSSDELGLRVREQQILPAPLTEAEIVDDHTLVNQGVRAFLKVFDDIKVRDDATQQISFQNPPEVLMMEAGDFYEGVAEYQADQHRIMHINELFEEFVEQL